MVRRWGFRGAHHPSSTRKTTMEGSAAIVSIICELALHLILTACHDGRGATVVDAVKGWRLFGGGERVSATGVSAEVRGASMNNVLLYLLKIRRGDTTCALCKDCYDLPPSPSLLLAQRS